jgi:putative aldouronate transport system substrate-binding protein
MKGKMKNAALAVFLILVTVSVFANGGGQRQGNVVSASARSGAPVTLEFWYSATVSEAGPPPEDWKAIKIVRDKLNINWVLSMLPTANNDRDVKINAAAAANSLPDLFYVRREVWQNLIKAGMLGALDDVYPLMPNRTKAFHDADAIEFSTYNGKSYAFADLGHAQPKNEGVLIRKDWLDKLGLKVPLTTDEYLNVMKAFTFNDPDGNGRNDTYGYGAFIEINTFEEGLGRRFDPFFGAYGVAGTWNLTRADPGLNIHKPAYFEALSFIKTMIDEKVLDPNWVSYQKDDFRAAWKQGRFGIMREQHSAYASESNYAPFDKNFPNGEWIVIDPPKGPRGDQSVGVYPKSYTNIYAVSAKTIRDGKGPDIARLYEWMSTPEAYFLLGWGEEGVNYLLDKDGIPVVEGLPDPAKGYTKPEMQPLSQLRSLVQINSDMELVSRYPTYKTPSGKTMSALVTLREMQAKPWTTSIGADALPTPNADVKRFYEQGVAEFLTGQRQLTRANWNAWLADFDKMGGAAWEKEGIEAATAANFLR